MRLVSVAVLAGFVTVLMGCSSPIANVPTSPRPVGAIPILLATSPYETRNYACPLALGGGTLVRDERSGLAFDHGASVEAVIWPNGYTAATVDGKAVLVDPNGSQVAREGDLVTATGGGGDPFVACMDVRLVEHGT